MASVQTHLCLKADREGESQRVLEGERERRRECEQGDGMPGQSCQSIIPE